MFVIAGKGKRELNWKNFLMICCHNLDVSTAKLRQVVLKGNVSNALTNVILYVKNAKGLVHVALKLEMPSVVLLLCFWINCFLSHVSTSNQVAKRFCKKMIMEITKRIVFIVWLLALP